MSKNTPPPDLAAIAKKYKVTPRTVRTWRAKGYDLNDPVRLDEQVKAQRVKPASVVNPAKRALECRKLRAQCETLEHDLSTLQSQYTRNDEIIQQRQAIEATTRKAFDRFRGCGDQWASMTAPEIEASVSKIIDTIHRALHVSVSYLTFNVQRNHEDH